MPYEGLGRRHESVATKAVKHGDPTVEDGFPGIADKVTQLSRFVDPLSTAATTIAISEPLIIQLGGIHRVRAALLPGGAVAGNGKGVRLWIMAADNSLVNAKPGSGTEGVNWFKFGRVTELDGTAFALVNADARDTFA